MVEDGEQCPLWKLDFEYLDVSGVQVSFIVLLE